MKYWWVSQNKTFDQEVAGGYMWSPQARSDGGRNQYYDNMGRVTPGDFLFSFSAANIAALGRIRSWGHESPKPAEFSTVENPWSNAGWRVDVEYEVLPKFALVRPKAFMDELRPHMAEKYAPLRANGDGPQNMYLTEVSSDFATVLLRHITATGYVPRSTSNDISADELRVSAEERLESEIQGNVPDETERQTLTRARRGQGPYRDGVLAKEGSCRFTGIDDPKLLRAGHLKPWAQCTTHAERLDSDNGLALTPTFDHLVDKGFISWDNSGNVILSPLLHSLHAETLGLAAPLNTGPWRPEQLPYVEYHRAHVFRSASTT